jgi:hypothetical protein
MVKHFADHPLFVRLDDEELVRTAIFYDFEICSVALVENHLNKALIM